MRAEDSSIFYITSNTYAQVIHGVVKESKLVCQGTENIEGFQLLKFVKQNISMFSTIDIFLIDLSALEDVDEEIIQALEMIRFMEDELRIVLVAANRYKGDSLLKKCFNMGIYNIVCTDDFLEIKEELSCCLTEGKRYKDAQEFKDALPVDKVIIKQEIKKTVNKVFISVVGSQKRMGVTHLCIMLAAYLRKRGFMVAIAEMNGSEDFERIMQGYDEQMLDDYFNIDGIDFYPNMDADGLSGILAKSYNFVIGDFGSFKECDTVTYAKGDVRIVVGGAKAWEIEHLTCIFEAFEEEALKELRFVFNLTDAESKKDIQEWMKRLGVVYFQDYFPDPFTPNFESAEKILEKYMPVKVEEKKRGFFRKR